MLGLRILVDESGTRDAMSHPLIISEFKHYYENFDKQSLDKLDTLYADTVEFTDPIHSIQGLVSLKRYFSTMCAGLTECQFEFVDEIIDEGRACFKWVMHYRHPALQRNAPLQLVGVSFIAFSDKIDSHEDLYDMGAMLYENVPVLGGIIRRIKSRVAAVKS
jgi:hypothetical protein